MAGPRRHADRLARTSTSTPRRTSIQRIASTSSPATTSRRGTLASQPDREGNPRTTRPAVGDAGFSRVDQSPNPYDFVAHLHESAVDLADAKQQLTAMLASSPHERWMDLGCGVGHDLGNSPRSVGLNASVFLLREAQRRRLRAALVAANANAIPVRAGTFRACRVERVLQHVPDPVAVLTEVDGASDLDETGPS